MIGNKRGYSFSISKKSAPKINVRFNPFLFYLAVSFEPYRLKPGYEGIKL